MKITFFTPHKQFPPMECDSVILNIADSVSGEFSGSYGIKKGHAKAVFSLAEGGISVSLNGNEVFFAECEGGFATVENDDVRVSVHGIKEDAFKMN